MSGGGVTEIMELRLSGGSEAWPLKDDGLKYLTQCAKYLPIFRTGGGVPNVLTVTQYLNCFKIHKAIIALQVTG